MGEGWSDWYALNHLLQRRPADQGRRRRVRDRQRRPAASATGTTTRTRPNFGDIGYDLTGPEVHADGEIWTATLWDLRKALVAKYGAQQGAEVAARLVTDGMPLTAPDPSFLDARDGILAADLDRYHGDEHRPDLVGVRAPWRRRLGRRARPATTPTRRPASTTRRLRATGSWSARSSTPSTGAAGQGRQGDPGRVRGPGDPAGAHLGHGGFGVKMAAGTYDADSSRHRVSALRRSERGGDGGRDHVAGLHRRAEPPSTAAGASWSPCRARTPALPAEFLLDDTAASVWATAKGATPYNSGPDQRVTVKLAKPATIYRLQVQRLQEHDVEPLRGAEGLHLPDLRPTASLWKTVKTGGFGYQTPRPTAPDLNYQTFTLAKPVEGHATSGSSSTRCRARRSTTPQAAELQVFGSAEAIVADGAAGRPDLHRQRDYRRRQPGRRRPDRAAERLRRDGHRVRADLHGAAGVAGRGRLGLDAAQRASATGRTRSR